MYIAISMTVVFGMAALAVDIGMLYSAQAELQRSADAASMAGTWELLNEDRLRGADYAQAVVNSASERTVQVAALNAVLKYATIVQPDQDVQFGHWTVNPDGSGYMTYGGDAASYNAVELLAQRNEGRGGSIALSFARLLGVSTKDLRARAIAAALDGISGFEVPEPGETVGLLPFALQVDIWNQLLAGTFTTGDNYSYDQDTQTVGNGPDGINELNLYPGAGATQLPPGNFGTVDIGSPNNSTADISRQIRFGVNESDLAYFGGRLELGPDGTLALNGDTGLSAAVKDDLISIIGQPRTIPLFSTVSGPGNNAMFTIVGFAGVRILDVRLTGAMSSKRVIIQPAVVVDDGAISGGDSSSSYGVYAPVRLVQ